jgi:hypothetical protein
MNISSVSGGVAVGGGLAATGSSIAQTQARFDRAAERVANGTLDDGGSAPLVEEVVDVKSESLVNQMLYSVFARQADQQKQAADLFR